MKIPKRRIFAVTLAAALTANTHLSAHEFWLDPVDFAPKVGSVVPIVHRIGQNFMGDTYPYVRKLSRRFAVIDAKGERPVKTIDGDDPAGEIKFSTPGLATVVYQRVAELVTFKTFADFETYLRYEGLEWVIADHSKAGKSVTNIRELYARFAKSLVNVGNEATGQDRAVGLTLEIIAEENPYGLAPGATLPIRVLYDGKPAANLLVKSFNRDDSESPRQIRTDAEGRARIEIPKPGETLISAVHMRPPLTGEKAEWHSLWASLTFKRP
jgi:uncharacterized GH25 family protein